MIFEFEVEYLDYLTEKVIKRYGFWFCNELDDAYKRIRGVYGQDCIRSLTVTLHGDSEGLIEFSNLEDMQDIFNPIIQYIE